MAYDFLQQVRKPSRYLGCEIHAVRPCPKGDKLHVALAFPDHYEIGMSHLGIALLYGCLNQTSSVIAERAFLPDTDLELILREKALPLTTLESKTPLHQVDLLGFTLAYELSYTNVLAMLDLGGIPLRSEQRSNTDPVIIAGGPCAFNPEPISPFIDAFVIGEAEYRLPQVCDLVRGWKESREPRETLFRALDDLEGLYVPSLFEWQQSRGNGTRRLVPTTGRTRPVRKCTVRDLDSSPYPDHPVVPFARIIHDRISIEAARGCPHACRFCQAGNLYRPYRERSPQRVTELVQCSLEQTGYEDVSLLALSIGDYSSLVPLVSSLMARIAPQNVSLSLPSLRVGSLEPSVVREILRVRKTGFTMAPEAATQRLRNVINKEIPEEDLLRISHLLATLGWRSLKLYFMIGLPTETQEDVEAIVRMSRDILKNARAAKGNHFQVTVNVSSFVPKAHTPLQWVPQQTREATEEKQRFLKKSLQHPGIRLKWHDPRLSLLEGLFARGDRRLADLLETAYRLGCRREGWSEHLRFDLWTKAFEQTSISPDDFLNPFPHMDEPLPWDWIDPGVDKQFFRQEWSQALKGETTPFYCHGRCGECGICRKPGTVKEKDESPSLEPDYQTRVPVSPVRVYPAPKARSSSSFRVRFSYRKQPPLHNLSHLETINVFYRALRRSGLPMAYTEGKHPHPRVSFSPALPVGVESLAEYMDIWVSRPVSGQDLLDSLNPVLPEGFSVIVGFQIPLNTPSLDASVSWTEYEITFPEQDLPEQGLRRPSSADLGPALEGFSDGSLPLVEDTDKGRRSFENLRQATKLEVIDGGAGLLCRLHKHSGSMPSPLRVVKTLFPSPPWEELRVRICKTQSMLLDPFPSTDSLKRKSGHGK